MVRGAGDDALQAMALGAVRLEAGIDQASEEVVGEDAVFVLGGVVLGVGGVFVGREGWFVIEGLEEGV